MPEYNNAAFPRVQFHLSKRDQSLQQSLEARAGDGLTIHAIAQRDLTAYYDELPYALPSFTEEEARRLVYLLDGSRINQDTLHYLRRDIVDGLHESSYDDLATHIRDLARFEWRAVIDAFQRYQRGNPYYMSDEQIASKLREVGLVRE
jgi:hypothetical protein